MYKYLPLLLIIALSACATSSRTGVDHTVNRSRLKSALPDTRVKKSGNADLEVHRKELIRVASSLVGAKYRYGGNSPKRGFDCSGFTCYVWSNFNVALPRSSAEQARLGRKKQIRHARAGDLIFFGTGSRVTHVGIVTAHSRSRLEVVHSTSSSGVRIDEIYSSLYWKSRALWAIDVADIGS